MIIHIQRGKGLRDRDVPLTPKLLEALRDYYNSVRFQKKLRPVSLEIPEPDATGYQNLMRLGTRT